MLASLDVTSIHYLTVSILLNLVTGSVTLYRDDLWWSTIYFTL